MNIPINKNFVNSLKESEGSLKTNLEDVKSIVRHLNSPDCKVVLIDDQCFIVFHEIINVEFIAIDYKRESDLNFLENKEVIDATRKNGNYIHFTLNEFIQGRTLLLKLKRLLSTLFPLIILNLLGYYFGASDGIKDVFAGLLTAVSIFIAIFSLFVTSHDYLSRKRLQLFESGQLSYYFSIDKYITQTGIWAIVASVFAIIVASGVEKSNLYILNVENIILIALLNLTFLAVYIILRSMVEFYIIRPGKFMLGDLKAESLNHYRKKNNQEK